MLFRLKEKKNPKWANGQGVSAIPAVGKDGRYPTHVLPWEQAETRAHLLRRRTPLLYLFILLPAGPSDSEHSGSKKLKAKLIEKPKADACAPFRKKKMQAGINGINNKKLRTRKVRTAVQQMQLCGVTHFEHIRLDMKDACRPFRRTTRVGAVIWTVSRDCSIRYRLTVCSDNVFTQTHTQTDCSDASPH